MVDLSLRDCDGIDLAGRNSLAIYWKAKLESKAASAFTLDDMILTGDEIQVDFKAAKANRFVFTFGSVHWAKYSTQGSAHFSR